MNLEGTTVLVDGYNIGLQNGTGIKTYGISLVQALNSLEAQVDVLFSYSSKRSSDPILNEVLFFDNQNATPDKLSFIKAMAQGASGLLYRARRVNSSELIIKRGPSQELTNTGILNLEFCYDIANNLYKRYKLNSKVSTPNKIDIWHATYPLPMRIKGAKKITTIHDLIPLRLPYTTLDNKKFFYKLVQESIKESEIIITVSESSKKDILTVFDIAPEKIHVTYQPIALKPFAVEEDRITKFFKAL